MESWSRLVSVAMVGVVRAGEPGPINADLAEPGAIADLLRLADQAGHEAADQPAPKVLRQAAILTVARRAAYMPRPVTGGLFPPFRPVRFHDGDTVHRSAEKLSGRECSSAATARLAMILTDRLHLLPEWLKLVGEAGYRPPDVLLPELLDLGVRQPEVARALAKVLGPRGEWLAGLNPRWAGILRAAQPQGPRAAGFQPGPELSRLLVALVRYDRHPLGRDAISVRPPVEGEEELIVDFLRGLPTPVDGGEMEIFAPPDSPLGELVSWVDPAFWVRNWQIEPGAIIAAISRSESRELLLLAFTLAVSRFKAIEWVEPLLAERLREPTEEGIGIFPLLPADRQQHWILAALRQWRSLEAEQPAFWLLTRSTAPWGRPVARLLCPLILDEVRHRADAVRWDWQQLMRQAALHLDPTLAAELTDLFAPELDAGTDLIPDLSRLLDDIAFRAAMTRELGSRPPKLISK